MIQVLEKYRAGRGVEDATATLLFVDFSSQVLTQSTHFNRQAHQELVQILMLWAGSLTS